MNDSPTQTPQISELEAVQVPVDGAELELELEPIRCFELTSRSRTVTVQVSTLGASITRYIVRQGGTGDEEEDDIVLGYKDVATMYSEGNPAYFGAVVGRVANRVSKGIFYLNDKQYQLERNDPPNHLHGGSGGFSTRIWKVHRTGVIDNHPDPIPYVIFALESLDGDQGYPADIRITATYSLRPSISETGTSLRLDMSAELLPSTSTASLSTPINLAQHSYFHLSSAATTEGILDHTLMLDCEEYTPPVDDDDVSIPIRQVISVQEDSTMDFSKPRKLRQAMEAFGVQKMKHSVERVQSDLTHRQPTTPYGFDHNFIVRKQAGAALPRIATLTYRDRQLSVHSTAPGVQVYTANYLGEAKNGSACKAKYKPWSGICLETQHFPSSLTSSANDRLPMRFAEGRCPILTTASPRYQHIMEYTVDHLTATAPALPSIGGSDTNGRKYDSIEAMWAVQDLSNWYRRSMDYYEGNCPTTVDGVLGGIGHISEIDLEGSRTFLERLELRTDGVAAECGAGIGRVTKGLLLDFCKRSDLIESSPRLLSAAPDHIGNESYRCRFYCIELQDWEPSKNKYALIWIQWSAIYLTDADFVALLKRCADALTPDGVIVIKENTCEEEAFVLDVDDASLTRSLPYWRCLIFEAGLRVIAEAHQDNFPDDIFPVPMLALRPILWT